MKAKEFKEEVLKLLSDFEKKHTSYLNLRGFENEKMKMKLTSNIDWEDFKKLRRKIKNLK